VAIDRVRPTRAEHDRQWLLVPRDAGIGRNVPRRAISPYRVTNDGATLLAHDAEPGCAGLLTN